MGRLLYLTLIISQLSLSYCSEFMRPRGIPLTKVPLYDPAKDFVCQDGSATISFNKINDDYCDCRDGSDEPGTAACPNGIFFCPNKGHIALRIRSMMVNDGVCDCCDGSDEWSPTAANCSDVCDEQGKKEREERLQQLELIKQGHVVKLGLVEQGKNMLMEKRNHIARMQQELVEAESLKADKEEAKAKAEAPEAEALEKHRLIEEARQEEIRKIEEARQEEQRKIDEEQRQIEEAQKALEPEPEKEAETTPEPSIDQQIPTPVDEQSVDEPSPPGEGEPDEHDEDFKIPEETPQRVVFPGYRGEDDEVPTDEGDNIDEDDSFEEGELPDEEKEEEEAGREEGLPEYDAETQALVDAAKMARDAFNEADNEVQRMKREITKLEESVNGDYGDNQEFRSLEGQCFDYNDHEYTYKLCPFEKAQQIPKNGGSATSLGTWKEWETRDGKLAMKFANGQGCWNGPSRSTHVRLQCGLETVLLAVSEPAKCEYVFVFTTPAACPNPMEVGHGHAMHEEL